MGMRVLTASASGQPPGPESSFLKLYSSEYHKKAMELVMDLLGLNGLVESDAKSIVPFGPNPLGVPNESSVWLGNYYLSRAATIYGGSSQIQRNTIAERILGLPREPRITKA